MDLDLSKGYTATSVLPLPIAPNRQQRIFRSVEKIRRKRRKKTITNIVILPTGYAVCYEDRKSEYFDEWFSRMELREELTN